MENQPNSVNHEVLWNCCRTCFTLIDNDTSVSIFDPTVMNSVLECLSIQINFADQMPHKICMNCADYIRSFHNFRLFVTEAESVLEHVVNSQQNANDLFNEIERLQKKCPRTDAIKSVEMRTPIKIELPMLVQTNYESNPTVSPSFDDDLMDLKTNVTEKSVRKTRRKIKRDNRSQRGSVIKSNKTRKTTEILSDDDVSLTLRGQKSQNDNWKRDSDENLNSDADFFESNDECKEKLNGKLWVNGKWYDHWTDIYDEETLNCKLCNEQFEDFQYLKKHMMDKHALNSRVVRPRHDILGSFPCPKCPDVLTTIMRFAIHAQQKHKMKRAFSCIFCPRKFYLDEHTNLHVIKIHFGEYNMEENPVLMCPKKQCATLEFKMYSSLIHHLRHQHQWTGFAIRKKMSKFIIGSKSPCEICGAHPKNIKAHMHDEHGQSKEKPVEIRCGYCEETFTDKKLLAKHKKSKHRKNRVCHLCGELYSTPDHYLKHRDKDEKTSGIKTEPGASDDFGEHVCQTCGKKLKTKHRLRAHIKQVHEMPTITCQYCNLKVKKNCFEIHMYNAHTGVPNHECNLCGRKFKQKWNLKSHMAFHTDERPLKCRFCDLRFRHSKTLRHHEMRHTGEKPHACTMCDKRFIQRVALKVHMKTHSGQRDYFCSMCPKTFTQSTTLNTHMKSHMDANLDIANESKLFHI